MSDAMLGYCGLFCGGCGIYQATQAGKPVLDDAGHPLVCDGCNSARLTPWCSDCAIKNCAREKGVRICGDCAENPCAKLTGFMDDPKYPYHKSVLDDMKHLQANGLDAFEKRILARYTCKSCGSRFDWLAKACPACKKPI